MGDGGFKDSGVGKDDTNITNIKEPSHAAVRAARTAFQQSIRSSVMESTLNAAAMPTVEGHTVPGGYPLRRCVLSLCVWSANSRSVCQESFDQRHWRH